MDSKQRFLQIYHEFIKDDNMLPSELYIVSFRYITIYHLIFGYITLYTWTSAHPTYPSPYHDIISTYEMRTRLIIVEGLPDSGKSTTAAMVAAELEARGRNVVCVEEGAADHPADVGDHDFPDFASERATILDTWRAFAAHAEPDTTYVFNCVLLQNPMCETMMRFGMSEDESRRYISDIAAIIAPLHPVVIYIDEPGAKAAIDGVLDERGDGWLNAVIDYHTAQGYGEAHGLRGYEGYIACLEERRERELRILRSLPVDSHIIPPSSDAKRISTVVDAIP